MAFFTWLKVPWKLVNTAGLLASTEDAPPSAAWMAASMGPSSWARMVSTRAAVSGAWGAGAARAELANSAKHTNWGNRDLVKT